MPRALVQISICLPLNALQAINDQIEGKSQNERIRKCVLEGFKVLKR
jgi:hypothetical protein